MDMINIPPGIHAQHSGELMIFVTMEITSQWRFYNGNNQSMAFLQWK